MTWESRHIFNATRFITERKKTGNRALAALVVGFSLLLSGVSWAEGPRPQQQQRQHGKEAGYYILKGRVLNLARKPVRRAVVLIPELGLTAETGEAGDFEFQGIPAVRVHIEIHADGYMRYVSDAFQLSRDELSFSALLTEEISEEIVVTATQTAKPYAETPVKTELITREKIENQEALNLAQALTLTPGVRVENNCQNCNFTQVRINGMEGKYSQILIDSAPVISALTGVYGLEQIPADMIERIEIVKGGGSALYGGNAVAGVINVLSREPQENATKVKWHQESIRGESYSSIGFHSSLVSKGGNTKAYLFANNQKRLPVDIDSDGFSELASIGNTSFGLNFYNHFKALDGHLKLGFFRIHEDRRGGDLFELPPHEANIAEWIKTDNLGFDARWNQFIGGRGYFLFSLSYVDVDKDWYIGSHQDPNAYGSTRNPLLVFNLQMNYEAGGHVLSAGTQYRHDRIRDEATGYGRIIEETYEETGLYLQDDFKISRSVSLLTGLRLNKHSAVSPVILTPRVSLLLKLSGVLNLRLSASTGFRAPQVFEEDLHISQAGGEGLIIQNSPSLKQENSYSLFCGLDYGVRTASGLFQFGFEGFYTDLNDAFVLHEIGSLENARILERINGSGARVYGLSLSLGLRLGRSFSFSSGWTFQKSRLDEPEEMFGSQEFFRTPGIYGYASLGYENPRVVNLDVSLDYTGSMKAPHYAGYITEDRLETTASFLVVNFKVLKRLRLSGNFSAGIFAGVYNLFDSYQEDLDIGVDKDSGYVYGPAKPRAFYGGMEFEF